MKKINYYSYSAIFAIVFLLILSKIIFIPVTHDEMSTATNYIRFSCWQIMMNPDTWPDNHILNTLFVKLFVSLFGLNQVVIRLPNLLSFVVYAIAVFRINKTALKENSIWFIPTSLLFVGYPYLLDFFGLCRGYGMATALTTLSVSYLLSGFLSAKNRDMWFSYSISILASYANFSLLIFLVANTIITWFYFYLKSSGHLKQLIRPTVIIAITFLLYLALIANPIFKIANANRFMYLPSYNMFTGTTISFVILCILVVYFICIFIRLKKDEFKISFVKILIFVPSSLVLLTIFVAIIQCILLKTPSPRGRTALFFFPLIMTSFVCLLALVPIIKRKIIFYFIAFLISSSCVFNVAYTYSLKYTIQWRYDENTFDVLNYLEAKKQPDDTIILKTDWHFFPSFYFYSYIGKTPWLTLRYYDKNIEINTDAEYYYVFSKSYKTLEPKFEPVYKVSEDRWLLRKRTVAIQDTSKNSINQNE